jgi:hypothetical protein
MSKAIFVSKDGIKVMDTTQEVPPGVSAVIFSHSRETDGVKILLEIVAEAFPRIGPMVISMAEMMKDDVG